MKTSYNPNALPSSWLGAVANKRTFYLSTWERQNARPERVFESFHLSVVGTSNEGDEKEWLKKRTFSVRKIKKYREEATNCKILRFVAGRYNTNNDEQPARYWKCEDGYCGKWGRRISCQGKLGKSRTGRSCNIWFGDNVIDQPLGCIDPTIKYSARQTSSTENINTRSVPQNVLWIALCLAQYFGGLLL